MKHSLPAFLHCRKHPVGGAPLPLFTPIEKEGKEGGGSGTKAPTPVFSLVKPHTYRFIRAILIGKGRDIVAKE